MVRTNSQVKPVQFLPIGIPTRRQVTPVHVQVYAIDVKSVSVHFPPDVTAADSILNEVNTYLGVSDIETAIILGGDLNMVPGRGLQALMKNTFLSSMTRLVKGDEPTGLSQDFVKPICKDLLFVCKYRKSV